MNPDRKTAAIVGVLFILGFAGAVTAALTKPILDAPDYLVVISSDPNRILLGAFFQFIMACACAGIGIALFPVLRRYNEGLALAAAGFRIIEAAFQIAGVILLLVLVTLSGEFVHAGSPDRASLQTAGVLLQAASAWMNNVAVLLAWSIGALAYYYIFYKDKLIPRWLSAWGLVGIALTILSSTGVMFRIIAPMSAMQGLFNAPIALQELCLAIWLIARGFAPSMIPSGLPRTDVAPA